VSGDIILVIVVGTALAFDFTNGFHDTANVVATAISTRAVPPRTAVTLAALLNFAGAFLSLEVAAVVAKGIVDSAAITPEVVFAGLIGAIAWNLLTWWFGLPSSSSHALIGGVVGSAVAAEGFGVIISGGLVGNVLIPALIAPVLAFVVALVGITFIYKIVGMLRPGPVSRGFKLGQLATSGLLALAHGTNDAQKTMGVITLALIASGHWSDTGAVPFWVKLVCALAIALGTYIGGWRIIRTLGKGIVEIEPRQGMAAQGSAAAVILASSQLGFALSTTHVATGSILGSGLGKPGAHVRWRVAGRMVVAWVITLPMAGLVGAATWWIGHLAGGGLAGALAMVVVLVAASALMFLRSRRRPVNADNVNEDWPEPAAVLAPVDAMAV
jgi:PiT family inorganic phosphate transporter